MLTIKHASSPIAMFLVALAACTSGGGESAGGTPSCKVGGACSTTQACPGGIEGCSSNCQCLGGTWQAPCPASLPETGTSCAVANVECGYTTSTNPCGAANCYCQNGTWSCGPSCAIFDAGADVEVTACASPGDCYGPIPTGPAVTCCIDKKCVYGQSAVDAVPCSDADVQLIVASSYDQSCQTSSDCVAVAEGNFCRPGAANCQSAAINKNAYAQYQSDVSKTNAAICYGVTSCPAGFFPCCQGGKCQMSAVCAPEAGVDASDAGASDAGDARAE